MNQNIIQAIAAGAEIITPTRRLSRHLRYRYAALQLDAGKSAWETPNILAWTSWCKREWQTLSFELQQTPPGKEAVERSTTPGMGEVELRLERQSRKPEPMPVLLNPCQQHWLWQRIVQSSSFANRCLNTASTAKLAMQSYEASKSALITIFPENVYLSEDAYAYKTWATEYEQQLARNNLIDTANLPDVIAENTCAQKNRQIHFYGFDVFTPQQEKLIAALQSVDIAVHKAELNKQNKKTTTISFPDERSEIRHAACWAKQKLRDQPAVTIGIISHNLKSQRKLINDEFDLILSPQSFTSFSNDEIKPYTISLGQPLQDYPMIHSAMSLLSLGNRKIPLAQLSTLLLSPFISGASEEASKRALFDARLRQYGEQSLTLKTLFWLAEEQSKPHEQCKQFIERLKAFDILFLSSPKKQSLRNWARTFSDWLTHMAWPGDRSLNNDEYQIITAWQDALQQLSSLDHVSQSVSYKTALSQLSRILGDQGFQPETTETPIQVTGVTGAAGMQFDYLWVLGMNDQVWPPPARPDPFIPLTLQTEANMPEATPKGQYELAAQITSNLINSAKEVNFSYPIQENDQDLRPSSLIKPWINDTLNNLDENEDDFKTAIFLSRQLENFTDNTAPAITKGNIVKGGTAIFKDQAACPFKAFARHRLYADSLECQDVGLDAAERGSLAHKVLQYFWQRLKTLDKLKQRSEKELDKLVHSVVSESLKQQAAIQPETFSKRFTQLEQLRLEALLKEWMVLERDRTAFKVISTEEWHHVIFDDIEVNMRIDRIDELANGDLIIIDYKTGNASVNDWGTDRPNEPQLPLYAITQEGHVAAVVFAKVKRGEMRFIGIAEDNDLIPGVKPLKDKGWDEKIEEWQVALSHLATEFRDGNAMVAPRDGQACQYCDLHALCRIYEKVDTQTDIL